MKEHNATKLTTEIIALSNSNTWESAKNEWVLSEIYEEDEPSTCLCGHFPIIEICVLRNRFNGAEIIVGNVCVKKFLGLPSDRIFSAIKRISKDNSKSLNTESIEYMKNRGWLTDWEYGFYCSTFKKRVLTEKQMKARVDINQKLLRKSKNQISYRGNSSGV
jgi:hypothetical protein